MIVRVTVETKVMPYGLYTSVSRAEFMSRQALRELATDCYEDGFHSDSQWWDARAREASKPRFVHIGSSGSPDSFCTYLLNERELQAYRKLVQTTLDKGRAKVVAGNPGVFAFTFCDY